MNIKKHILFAGMTLLITPWLTSCLGGDDDKYDYTAWKDENESYYTRMEESVGTDGKKVYEKITPDWAPSVTILAQWHNDRSLTSSNLVPMDNSTVDVVYDCYYVDGTRLDASWLHYADSVYTCKPNSNIVGFWTMLTHMHVGDSVTCVIPMNAGYGAASTSAKPYSTLIYHMKLKGIRAYEVSGK